MLKDKKTRRIALSGLPASAPALLLSAIDKGKHPALIVADDPDAAGYLYNDLCQILGQEAVQILPSGYRRDIKYGQPDPPSQILRMEAIAACSIKATRYIVSCPEGLAEKVPSPDNFQTASLQLKQGGRRLMGDVVNILLELGFCKVDYVYEPGQFARRGSILDVYSYSHELPYRIDFFDDEIDSIRSFNVETQLSEEKLESINIVGAMDKTAGQTEVSFLSYMHPDSPIWCHDLSHLKERIHTICTSGVSSSVIESGEGDAQAMQHAVDPEVFASELESRRLVLYGVRPNVTGE